MATNYDAILERIMGGEGVPPEWRSDVALRLAQAKDPRARQAIESQVLRRARNEAREGAGAPPSREEFMGSFPQVTPESLREREVAARFGGGGLFGGGSGSKAQRLQFRQDYEPDPRSPVEKEREWQSLLAAFQKAEEEEGAKPGAIGDVLGGGIGREAGQPALGPPGETPLEYRPQPPGEEEAEPFRGLLGRDVSARMGTAAEALAGLEPWPDYLPQAPQEVPERPTRETGKTEEVGLGRGKAPPVDEEEAAQARQTREESVEDLDRQIQLNQNLEGIARGLGRIGEVTSTSEELLNSPPRRFGESGELTGLLERRRYLQGRRGKLAERIDDPLEDPTSPETELARQEFFRLTGQEPPPGATAAAIQRVAPFVGMGLDTLHQDRATTSQEKREGAARESRENLTREGRDFAAEEAERGRGFEAGEAARNRRLDERLTGAQLRTQETEGAAGRESREAMTQADIQSREKMEWERLSQNERLAIADRESRLSVAQAQLEAQLRKDAKLSDKQLQSVANIDATIDAMRDILRQKSTIDTGPFQSLFQWGLNAVGAADNVGRTERNVINAALINLAAEYRREMTGQQGGQREMEELAKVMPKMSDNDETFQAKGLQALRIMQRRRDIFLKALRRANKNTLPHETRKPVDSTKVRPEDRELYERAAQAQNRRLWR